MSGESVKSARVLDDNADGRAEAARLLRYGGLVGFATETVYGLGADATSPEAVARIYAAKGRPSFNPLIAHVTHAEDARREGVFDEHASALAEKFWPGPLTLVVPAAPGGCVCELARAGLATIALRVPSHHSAQALLAAVGRPVAAPSANRSGRLSPVTAADVVGDLGSVIDAVLDAGQTSVGLESTIVACLGGAPVVLRPGGDRDPRASHVLSARSASGMEMPCRRPASLHPTTRRARRFGSMRWHLKTAKPALISVRGLAAQRSISP